MPDPVRTTKTYRLPKILVIKPFANYQRRQPPNASRLDTDIRTKQLTQKQQPRKLGQKYKEYTFGGGPRRKPDWLRVAMENQLKLKRECSDNVMVRTELRRFEYDPDYQKWKREPRGRQTPAVIRGTSADRVESPCRSDSEDVSGYRTNREVCIDTVVVHSEADDNRRIPDIMKPLKEDDCESSPPGTYMKGFSSYHTGFSDITSTKKRVGKLLLPPITDVNTRRGRQLLEHIRYSDDTSLLSDRENAKNQETKRKAKKAKRKKRAKEQKTRVELEVDCWDYESDFESDSESSVKLINKKIRKTKRRHKKKHGTHARRVTDSDDDFETGQLQRKKSNIDVHVPSAREEQRERRRERERKDRTQPVPGYCLPNDTMVRTWLRQSPVGSAGLADDQVDMNRAEKKSAREPKMNPYDKQAEDDVRNFSPNSGITMGTKVEYNCNPGSKMAPWAWKLDNNIDKMIDEDEDAIFLRDICTINT